MAVVLIGIIIYKRIIAINKIANRLKRITDTIPAAELRRMPPS